MKSAFVLLCVVLVGVVVASETPQSPVYGYHLREGIPRANAIRAAEKNGARIVGGSVTNIAQVPYQVGFTIQVMTTYTSVCGGSLISANRIITAAHCRNDGNTVAQSFTAVMGSRTLFYGGTRVTIAPANVIMHPQWNWTNAANDIAVAKLANNVAFTGVIQPINLPYGHDAYNMFVGESALASGFGATSDNSGITQSQVLSSVRMPVVPDYICRDVYSNWYHATNLCASGERGRSTCGGDSGGPLAVDRSGGRILAGVTLYTHNSGCQANQPAVFTRINSYLDWIRTV